MKEVSLMGLLDFFKRIQSKSTETNLKSKYLNEHSENAYLAKNPQFINNPDVGIDNAEHHEQHELDAFKAYLAKDNQFLMTDFMRYEHDLTNRIGLKERLQNKEKLSDYPESKQKELQVVVGKFVKNHLPEGAGYDKFYGYNASVEVYFENNKEIKIGIIDDADQPYIKVTIDKHTGRADFKYIGQYEDLSEPNFRGKLNVTSIISKGTRSRKVNKELDFER